jgi:1-phosphatidylinositol-3-phosphate 5-kinase
VVETEYMSRAYYHHLPTVLCKILGVYTVRYDNKDTGRKAVENVVVMENIFYQVRLLQLPTVV